MTVELVKSDVRLQALSPAWNELAESTARPNVFYEPWYLLAAASAFEEKILHGFIWSKTEPQRLIGYLPIRVNVRPGLLRPRVVENWNHDFCFSGEPLIRSGYEAEFWHLLLARLDERPKLGSTLRLRLLSYESASFEALRDVLKDQSRWHRLYRRYNRAFLYHDADPETYLRSHLTKKKRKEYSRQRRRLAELGELRSETLTQSNDLSDWINEFMALEKSGWKGNEDTALASQKSSSDFFKTVCGAAYDEGKLDMAKLSLDDEPIAMLVTFLARPAGNFTFKIAFNEAFGKYSPGVLLELDYLVRFMSDEGDSSGWSDSCAAEDHPMINRLWRDKLELCSIKISESRPIARLASIYHDKLSRLAALFKD